MLVKQECEPLCEVYVEDFRLQDASLPHWNQPPLTTNERARNPVSKLENRTLLCRDRQNPCYQLLKPFTAYQTRTYVPIDPRPPCFPLILGLIRCQSSKMRIAVALVVVAERTWPLARVAIALGAIAGCSTTRSNSPYVITPS